MRLISRKINIKNINIIATITNNYGNGIYSVIIDEDYNNFEKGEELITNSKQFLKINEDE